MVKHNKQGEAIKFPRGKAVKLQSLFMLSSYMSLGKAHEKSIKDWAIDALIVYAFQD